MVAALALQDFGSASAAFFGGGALLYLIGTLLVTVFGNVPLNRRLEAITPASPHSTELWKHYLKRWTMLNTLRSAAAMIAALSFSAGLFFSSS